MLLLPLVPFIYLFICGVFMLLIGSERKLHPVALFAICILLTPIGAAIISVLLPKRPCAVCMYKHPSFKVGKKYSFRVKKKEGKVSYTIFNGIAHHMSEKSFHGYFSVIA